MTISFPCIGEALHGHQNLVETSALKQLLSPKPDQSPGDPVDFPDSAKFRQRLINR